jgi:hypothetical protein
MCSADLAPDHARTGFFAAGNAVNVCDALAEVPLRVLCAVDAFEREEAHVGVGVAFAALVADMAGFDVYCNNYYSCAQQYYDCSYLRRWLFSEDIAS